MILVCCRCGNLAERSGDLASYCMECYWASQAEKGRVYAKIYKAKKSGLLKDASNYVCADCFEPAQVWDHRDYGKPLDVIPVCRSCNWKRGPALSGQRAHQIVNPKAAA